MTRALTAIRPLLLALSLACAGGCASSLTEGDRLFLAGDLARAEIAYRSYLTSGRAGGNAEARARYRLGLIYALPGSDLHDWEMANRALSSLVESETDSAWSQHASLLLSLHAERERLERELEARDDRVSSLLKEVVALRQAAADAGDEVEDREARVEQLASEIAELRKSIGELGERLAAREEELDRIKRIDLQTPP